ncbi:tetratricopeptide repeat protein [Phenylobacterium immobile]|uniref:tetratricopeptide repeat protein n=1 Tax=Phenylobacterium immobile TaxID=21 RepID=UPI000B157F9D|nr:tetratricopeptide repeat protein [Phenylobacterium immobile]
MTDLFEEVEEQLRSDRYRTLAMKALPIAAAVVVLSAVGVGGYWGYTHWRGQAETKASEQFTQAAEAFAQGDAARATGLWTEISKSSAKGYKSLALSRLAAQQLTAGRTAAAVKLYDEAADAAGDPAIADISRLKSALALIDTAPYKDVEARLKPLMEEGRPYRVQAREALGFARLMAADTAGARQEFVVISQMLDAPEGARSRAKAAITLIDSGAAVAVPATVRAAAALPPPNVSQGAAPQGPAAQAPAQTPAQGPQ